MNKQYLVKLIKNFGVFSASFLVTLIGVGILFTGLLSKFSSAEPILNDTILSILIFFLLFVVLPAVAGHYVLLKVNKKEASPLEKPLRFSLISTLVMAIISVFIISFLVKPRFAPYTLQLINEQEFQEEMLAEDEDREVWFKEMLGHRYHVTVEKQFDEAWLYQGDERLLQLTMLGDPDRLLDLWFNESLDSLIVIESRGSVDTDNGYEQITRYYKQTKDSKWQAEILSLKQPGIYSRTRILQYYPLLSKLLLLTNGGDGCGGSGEIWSITGTRENQIQLVESGCADNGNPEYLGFSEEKLIFGARKPNENGSEFPIISKVYTQDPRSGIKQTILEIPDLPRVSSGHLAAENSKDLYLLDFNGRSTSVFMLNLDTHSITSVPDENYFGHD